jgi:iron complex outermembrane receptor protein
VPSVTVSATRRNASLQSVPVAVSVLDGDALNNANRTSIDTIVQEVPSVTFRQQGGNKDTTIFVRGIGTISTSPGVEPTVSTVIDGVVYARPGQATLDCWISSTLKFCAVRKGRCSARTHRPAC